VISELKHLEYIFVPSVLYKDLQKNERIFSKNVLLYMYMYVRLCVGVFFCLLLCTPFIADEELCRWSFDLGVLSSSLLIAMISALPL
jgi:hypothetical protein